MKELNLGLEKDERFWAIAKLVGFLGKLKLVPQPILAMNMDKEYLLDFDDGHYDWT